MTLKDWLDGQGFPHGMECVGEARLQQLWDAAQKAALLEAADKCIELASDPDTSSATSDAAEYIAEELRRMAGGHFRSL